MVNKVISTKLTEEEHEKFLDFCNKKGNSPSATIKQAVLKSMEESKKDVESMSLDELKRELGLKK